MMGDTREPRTKSQEPRENSGSFEIFTWGY